MVDRGVRGYLARRVRGGLAGFLVAALLLAIAWGSGDARQAVRAAAGERLALAGGSLSGFVYVDLDNSGTIGQGEPGISDVQINLNGRDGNGILVSANFTTGANGAFTFGNLPDGTYVLSEPQQPAAYNDGREAAGTPPNGTAFNDVISDIVIANGAAYVGYTFGELPRAGGAATGSLGGIVYIDLNTSGAYDVNEPGVPATVLTLSGLDTLGAPVQRAIVSGQDGRYSFDALPAGIYTITETQPAGYTDGQETNGTYGGTVSNDQFSGIVLPAGGAGTGYNFGERLVPPTPTPTATFTPSPTRATSTPTATSTPSSTSTPTTTPTASPTRTPSPTPTSTPTGSVTPTITRTVTTTTTITPTATFTPTPTPQTGGGGTVTPPPAPVAVRGLDFQTMNDKPSAGAGETVQLTLVLKNPNAVPATNVVVTNTLPPGLALQGANASGGSVTFADPQLTFTVGTLAPGATATLALNAVVLGGGGPVINRASYTATINGQTYTGDSLSGIGSPALPNTGAGDQPILDTRTQLALLVPLVAVLTLGIGTGRVKRARRRRA